MKKSLSIVPLNIDTKYSNFKNHEDIREKHEEDESTVLCENYKYFTKHGAYITFKEQKMYEQYCRWKKKGCVMKQIILQLLSPYFNTQTCKFTNKIKIANTIIEQYSYRNEIIHCTPLEKINNRDVKLSIKWNKKANLDMFNFESDLCILSGTKSFCINRFYLDKINDFQCGQVLMNGNSFDQRASVYQILLTPDEVENCISDKCTLKTYLRLYSYNRLLLIQFIALYKTEHDGENVNINFGFQDSDFGYEHFFKWSPVFTEL